MSGNRPTVRPVTLARLVEATHLCVDGPQSTETFESALDVTHRRARETILEAVRIDLLRERTVDDESVYETTSVGERFLDAIRNENWQRVSDILQTRSPHYDAFLNALGSIEPADLDAILTYLEDEERHAPQEYNQTGVEVIGDWAERLGTVQRNAFTGTYYRVQREGVPADFPQMILSVYDDLEEQTAINLRQRYLSIPEVREHYCERAQSRRDDFDAALLALVNQNVGKLELSGAPIDTGAKDAMLGIKEIEPAQSDGLVTTSQSTDQIMKGVEQFGKRYYYFTVHDRNLTFDKETNP